MTPPTLLQEAQQYFQTRENETRVAYEEQINSIAKDWSLEGWHNARDLREDWRNSHLDWQRAMAATPCSHRVAAREPHCDCCWMISTYSQLSHEENEDDE